MLSAVILSVMVGKSWRTHFLETGKTFGGPPRAVKRDKARHRLSHWNWSGEVLRSNCEKQKRRQLLECQTSVWLGKCGLCRRRCRGYLAGWSAPWSLRHCLHIWLRPIPCTIIDLPMHGLVGCVNIFPGWLVSVGMWPAWALWAWHKHFAFGDFWIHALAKTPD